MKWLIQQEDDPRRSGNVKINDKGRMKLEAAAMVCVHAQRSFTQQQNQCNTCVTVVLDELLVLLSADFSQISPPPIGSFSDTSGLGVLLVSSCQ